jgi:hypothetical protein
MPRRNRQATEKPYVLSRKDAWALLAAASNYANAPERQIDGKDRADILAEAALMKGLFDLSSTISAIHLSVMQFHKGDYKALQYLTEHAILRDRVTDDAKDTSFATAVRQLLSPLGYIAELEERLGGRDVDWDASARVLLKVKNEMFPDDLTMVEKLAIASLSTTKRQK